MLCLDLDHFKGSTTRSATPSATRCCRGGRAPAQACARRTTSSRGSAATSSPSCTGRSSQPQRCRRARRAHRQGDRRAVRRSTAITIIIGASVGIAVAPADGSDAETLMKNADLALYRAKARGPRHLPLLRAGMDAALQERRALEIGLRAALAGSELRLVYQPLFDLERQPRSAASRRCCAGTIPSAAPCRRRSSSRSPRRPG